MSHSYLISIHLISYDRSFLNVLVWDDGQDAVHNLVTIQVIDSVGGTLGLVVLNDGGGHGSTEVVLLDVAFFQCSLGGK
jgi:hypothetical protein